MSITANILNFQALLLDCASTNSALKIVMFSRAISACSKAFSSLPKVRLQDLTEPDIRAYIRIELLQDELLIEMDSLEPGFVHEVENTLMKKASGVLLWIYLVVRSLLNGLAEYFDRAKLMKMIGELPNDLEALYDHMFYKMSHGDQRDSSLLLQLTVRATDAQQGSFTALQLHTAFHTKYEGATNSIFPPPKQDALRVKAIDGILRSRCCGLVEVQYQNGRGTHRYPITDFLQHSVYDYLRTEHIWSKIISICNITPADRDYRLLAASVQALDRLQSCGPAFQHNVKLLFTSCLEYSYTLSDAQDKRYANS